MSGVFFLVGWCNRAAICVMQTKLGEGDFVEDRCLRQLVSSERQQQRLHDQRIERKHADQLSPERTTPLVCLI